MGRLLAVALLALVLLAPSAHADLQPWPNDAYTKADPTTDTTSLATVAATCKEMKAPTKFRIDA